MDEIIMNKKDCVKYHHYLYSLSKMQNDDRLWFWERGIASFLRNRIDKYHYLDCVYKNNS